MKHSVSALWALSTAILAASSVSAQSSLISLDLGGGGSSSSVASSAPVSSSVAATSAPSSVATSSANASTATSATTTSPAYAAGTVTYIPPALITSTSSIDVTSLPSSVPRVSSSASSNYTLPSATATGTFLSLPSLVSKPYQIVFANTDDVPTYKWNLALNSSSEASKEATCEYQMRFCETAGCEDPKAKLKNFCETKYMGVACSCSKGESRLLQYQWPVMLADCQGRNTACRDACIKPNVGVADTNSCVNECLSQYGNTCGKPGQYAANYAVSKKGDKPSYTIVQGGTASAGFRTNAAKLVVALSASSVTAFLLFGL